LGPEILRHFLFADIISLKTIASAVLRFRQPLVFRVRFAYGTKGDIDRAIAKLDRAIKLDPDDASAYFDRGAAYRHKGDYELAVGDFETAVNLLHNSDPLKVRARARIVGMQKKIASAKAKAAVPTLLDNWTNCKQKNRITVGHSDWMME